MSAQSKKKINKKTEQNKTKQNKTKQKQNDCVIATNLLSDEYLLFWPSREWAEHLIFVRKLYIEKFLVCDVFYASF